MNFVRRASLLSALLGVSSSAWAFGTLTFQYIVPANGVWPPTTFSPNGNWNTVANSLNQPALPGIQIPGIDLALAQANVPLALRGELLSVQLVVDGFARVSYTVDNGSPTLSGNVTTTLTGTLTVLQPVTAAPGSFTGTTLLTVVSTANEVKSTTVSTEGPPNLPDFQGTDTASGVITAQNSSTTSYTSGTTFDAFDSNGTVYLPVGFVGAANASGSGNYGIQAATFGAARVTVTYTYLPESEWAWAGLPFVAGGWLVRRRFAARSKN